MVLCVNDQRYAFGQSDAIRNAKRVPCQAGVAGPPIRQLPKGCVSAWE